MVTAPAPRHALWTRSTSCSRANESRAAAAHSYPVPRDSPAVTFPPPSRANQIANSDWQGPSRWWLPRGRSLRGRGWQTFYYITLLASISEVADATLQRSLRAARRRGANRSLALGPARLRTPLLRSSADSEPPTHESSPDEPRRGQELVSRTQQDETVIKWLSRLRHLHSWASAAGAPSATVTAPVSIRTRISAACRTVSWCSQAAPG
jgi:hypothetical protein